jgi:hypothetical protein
MTCEDVSSPKEGSWTVSSLGEDFAIAEGFFAVALVLGWGVEVGS